MAVLVAKTMISQPGRKTRQCCVCQALHDMWITSWPMFEENSESHPVIAVSMCLVCQTEFDRKMELGRAYKLPRFVGSTIKKCYDVIDMLEVPH